MSNYDNAKLDILREYKQELEQCHKTGKVTPKLRHLRILANNTYGSVKDSQMFEIVPELLIHKSVINAYKAVGLTKSQYEFLNHVKGGERMKDRKIRPNNIKEEDLVIGRKFWMYEDKVENYIRSGVIYKKKLTQLVEDEYFTIQTEFENLTSDLPNLELSTLKRVELNSLKEFRKEVQELARIVKRVKYLAENLKSNKIPYGTYTIEQVNGQEILVSDYTIKEIETNKF